MPEVGGLHHRYGSNPLYGLCGRGLDRDRTERWILLATSAKRNARLPVAKVLAKDSAEALFQLLSDRRAWIGT